MLDRRKLFITIILKYILFLLQNNIIIIINELLNLRYTYNLSNFSSIERSNARNPFLWVKTTLAISRVPSYKIVL